MRMAQTLTPTMLNVGGWEAIGTLSFIAGGNAKWYVLSGRQFVIQN